MTAIALLGATGHIAKSLIAVWPEPLLLYARRPEAVTAFIAAEGLPADRLRVFPLSAFGHEPVEVVINAIGLGQPGKVAAGRLQFFRDTERFDNLVLDWQERHPHGLYLFFSSGAVYGAGFAQPGGAGSQLCLPVNPPDPQSFYGLAKYHAEAKHRASADHHIVDIRIFGFVSRFIDLEGELFLSELARALLGRHELVTGAHTMVRDYTGPTELAGLITACIAAWQRATEPLNCAVDLRSTAPVDKFELLDHLAATLGLRYRTDHGFAALQATGAKPLYYSTLPCSAGIDWQSGRSALQAVRQEFAAFDRADRGYES